MSEAKFFLDTNIFIYSFDKTSPEKQTISKTLIEAALTGKGCISFQVIQEFMNVALRRFTPPMTSSQAQQYLENILLRLCAYFPNETFYQRALGIHNRWRFSWYDSLVITAALESSCDILYSEDLQHDQVIENLRVVNPFI
jgi:predicted nucleic acid-binding protein